ncbi:MAG: hypothetical protein J0L92_16855 [Deltaproteobacteria bacterium]|nr:hypothetical protein [Deltaproteobacteria bacterium]
MRTPSPVSSRLALPCIALALATPLSGCSAFVILAREARGSGDDGTLSVGQQVSGDTNGGTSAVTPGCGSGDGTPERRYFFTAPETRRYVASTQSSYDAVLAIYPHGGTGEPIGCNDDDGSTARSRLAFDAQAGVTYDVVVDGYGSNSGGFTLTVQLDDGGSGGIAPPPGGNVLRVGSPVSGSTVGGADSRQLSCGAPTVGTPDVTYTFTATESGVYVFHTQTDYDGTLEIFDGATSLGCNDDDGSTRASRVTTSMEAGRTYQVVVDGFGANQGSYQLTVDHLGAQSASGGALALGQVAQGTTIGAPDTIQLPCGASQPGTPDVTYTFTPPEDGNYVFRTQTDYDGVLAVYENGSSLGCNDDDQSTRSSRVGVQLSAGHTYQIVLDGFAGGMGSYQLTATHPIARPTGPIVAGQTVQGSTVGGADVRVPPCGSAPGTPEQIWTFTAPTTATYRIHMDSDYDGVLAVYPVGAPDPLMCNDDTGSTRASEIEGSLIAGQRYEIVVDGYGGGEGTYTLRLDMLSGVGGTPVAAPSSIPSSIHGGPLPENLGEMTSRCAAAQAITTGRFTGVLEPTEGASQLSCGSGGPGGDVVYSLTLAAASEVFFHVAADFEVGLELRRQCTSAVERCVSAPAQSGTDVTMTLPAGTYFVVLDAMDPSSRGPVHLDVNVRPAPAPAAGVAGGAARPPEWPPWGW